MTTFGSQAAYQTKLNKAYAANSNKFAPVSGSPRNPQINAGAALTGILKKTTELTAK